MKKLGKFFVGILSFLMAVIVFIYLSIIIPSSPWWDVVMAFGGTVMIILGCVLMSANKDQAGKLWECIKDIPTARLVASLVLWLVAGFLLWESIISSFGHSRSITMGIAYVLLGCVCMIGFDTILEPGNRFRWARFFWELPGGPWHFPSTQEQCHGLSISWVNDRTQPMATLASETFPLAEKKEEARCACQFAQSAFDAARIKANQHPSTFGQHELTNGCEIAAAKKEFIRASKAADRKFGQYYRLVRLLKRLEILEKHFDPETFRQKYKPTEGAPSGTSEASLVVDHSGGGIG